MDNGLASRLNRLFDVVHEAGMAALSNAEAAAGIAGQTGVFIDPAYLHRVRNGSETRPPEPAELTAIAEFFGVPASYLTDRDRDPRIDAQLNLLQALRDHRVRHIRLCGHLQLSPNGLNNLAAIVASQSQ